MKYTGATFLLSLICFIFLYKSKYFNKLAQDSRKHLKSDTKFTIMSFVIYGIILAFAVTTSSAAIRGIGFAVLIFLLSSLGSKNKSTKEANEDNIIKRKMSPKKKKVMIILIAIFSSLFVADKIAGKILISNLKGTIYYIKSVDDTKCLFKSDANMKNEKSIYKHIEKEDPSYEELPKSENEDIPDFFTKDINAFRYDEEKKLIYFSSSHKGKSYIFSIKEDETTPTPIDEFKYAYKYIEGYKLKRVKKDGSKLIAEKGSIYLVKNGKKKCIKRFLGIYSKGFTGYRPIGLSPDERYLVYDSNGKFAPFITEIREDFFGKKFANYYIKDLKTGITTKFIDGIFPQWVMN